MLPLDALVFNNSQIWLSGESHEFGSGAGCIMEWVSILQYGYACGLSVMDQPPCTNSLITDIFICTNDFLPDDDRQRLVPFIPRIAMAKRTSKDAEIAGRLRIWSAKYMRERHSDLLTEYEVLSNGIDRILATNEEELVAAGVVFPIWNLPTYMVKIDEDGPPVLMIDEIVDFLDALLDEHQKLIHNMGLALEDEFCEFAESET